MAFYELSDHASSRATSTQPWSEFSSSAVALRKQDDTITLDHVPSEPRPGVKTTKPLSFHMSFLALNLMVLLVSLDATALAVAIPVKSLTLMTKPSTERL